MGTSSSSKGSNGRQPLVPAGVDDEPGAPQPVPEPQRFRAFRTSFGKYLKSKDTSDLRKSLGHYARTSTGGSDIGPRRFGAVYSTGEDFYETLSSLGGDGVAAAAQGLSRDELRGQPLDVVCQRLATVLTPENGDAERVRQSIDEAMAEVLGEDEPFDPDRLDDETLHRIIAEYLSQAIFQDIVEEVGGSWAQAPDETRTAAAERELLELIRVIVDDRLGGRLMGRGDVTRAQIGGFLRQTVRDVWRSWEQHHD
ncbi:MAG: hypothetical protein DI565_16440 [Ancylobacter novellus]|uniref:Uncharacterized protein n=1 Tax=Ancylobacter novellus TaxID=921 RepID=A0A2W5K8T3_ANCNO|nr:MAG: hypothetical protein DI565_16440 [Ancylobacter novellus]